VVNWNSGSLVARSVAALQQAAQSGAEVSALIIVDNASRDSSLDFELPTSFRVEIVRSAHNLGFAAACNKGAALCAEPYLLFLNPDVEVEPETLGVAMRHLVEDSAGHIGIVGVRLTAADGRTQRSCARLPTPAGLIGQALGLDHVVPWLVSPHFMTEWDHDETREVGQVMGAFMLMRRSDFVRLGGFDERFFLYMEDVDLAVRAAEQGQATLFVHDACARHEGGGTTRSIPDIRLFYAMRSRILYARKHFGIAGRYGVEAAILAGEPAVRLVGALVCARWRQARAILRAAWWLWSHYPYRRPADAGEIARRSGHRRDWS
jgi:GT2 family glycosyltransferase